MIRWNSIAAGAAVVVGAAFVTGASVPPRKVEPVRGEEAKPRVALGPKTGYFNMAQVMRDFRKAQAEVVNLNKHRAELSEDLIKWRGDYIKLQQRMTTETAPASKEPLAKQLLELAHKIEMKDREVNKALNDRATEIISNLYDDVYAAAREMAKERGLTAVLAYPDAVGEKERNDPMIKELKLKPPAAQPFYLDRSVDYTNDLIQRLNQAHPREVPPVPGAPGVPGAKLKFEENELPDTRGEFTPRPGPAGNSGLDKKDLPAIPPIPVPAVKPGK